MVFTRAVIHENFPRHYLSWTVFREFILLGESQQGSLNHQRYGHASISNGLETLTIGGIPGFTNRPNMLVENFSGHLG